MASPVPTDPTKSGAPLSHSPESVHFLYRQPQFLIDHVDPIKVPLQHPSD